MATVIQNQAVGQSFYLLQVAGHFDGKMGQFCMLRAWDSYPVLSRPISIFDCQEDHISFLYKVVGQGTELLARLKAGDDIDVQGPYGNGFPEVAGKGCAGRRRHWSSATVFGGKNIKSTGQSGGSLSGFH